MTVEKLRLDTEQTKSTINLTRFQSAISDTGLATKFNSVSLQGDDLVIDFSDGLNSRERRILMQLVSWSQDKLQPGAPEIYHFFDDTAQITTSVVPEVAYSCEIPVIKNNAYWITWTYEIGSYGWRDAKSSVLLNGTPVGETQGSSGLFFNLNSYSSVAGSTLYVPPQTETITMEVQYGTTFLNLSARIRRIHFTATRVLQGS